MPALVIIELIDFLNDLLDRFDSEFFFWPIFPSLIEHSGSNCKGISLEVHRYAFWWFDIDWLLWLFQWPGQ